MNDKCASIHLMKSGVLALALFAAGPAPAADLVAANPRALAAAIERAGPGDRIILSGGRYGDLTIGPRRGQGALTISAADAASPPVFRSIFVRDADNVTFDNLEVTFGVSAAPLTDSAVEIRRSSGVRLKGMTIRSSANRVAGDDAYGVIIRDSRDVAVLENSLHDVFRAVAVFDSDDVMISANTIARAGSDGVVARGVVGLVVENNTLSDFAPVDPAKWHPDGVQLWSRGARRANERIVIRGNIIRRGEGAPAQGIFIKSPEILSRDILIEGNRIEQAMGQGIFVQHAIGVTIRSNILAAAPPVLHPPAIEVRMPFENAVVENNTAPKYRLPAEVVANANRRTD
ncbi:MAG: right-handed parallel beta-helix repeat-containing protein [Parvularculaceae bacterium]|nr:right-handed parallel beta-helix repeat-containing protein [Parvularculaceae bacterium]